MNVRIYNAVRHKLDMYFAFHVLFYIMVSLNTSYHSQYNNYMLAKAH